MAYHLTFNATTKLWSLDGTSGYISYPSTVDASAGGPYTVDVLHVPFDPVHKTGGTFWHLEDGPYAGYLVSSSTNLNGYGDITVTDDSDPGTPGGDIVHVNPLADWRVLIKGMGGATGNTGTHALTFNADTQLWTRTATGIIAYDSDIAHGPSGDGTYVGLAGTGPFKVTPVTVPFDPVHETGGSFWELKEGTHVGYLVSAHTNSLGYGDITVDAANYDRGPGAVLATLYHDQFYHPSGRDPKANPHLAGASKLYNKGGEFHMTLLVDDPNVRVPKPKETHYAVEFWNPDTEEWVETFAGMIWDVEATDTEVVYYGIDYLALLQFVVDERFDPAKPDRPTPNGSKYVAKTIKSIVESELDYAIGALDSPVGFISRGTIANMTYSTTIYATFKDTLSFVVGLLNSWRAGTGKFTELRVEKKVDGTYEFVVEDDPGILRPQLSLEYGVLAQGYQVRPFGRDWASRVNMIGRDLNGTQIKFQTVSSPQSMARWGRISGPVQYQDVVDDADLRRRTLQAAIDASRIGRQVGVGTKLGSYRPFEGYNLLDMVPVIINHGAIDTSEFVNDEFNDADTTEDASGTKTQTWGIIGIQWESYDDGHWLTTPILYPKGTGSVKLGDVQGAFATNNFDDGTSKPILPRNTTPDNILLALIVIQNRVSDGGSAVFYDDPAMGSTPSEEWTILGNELCVGTDMTVGPPAPMRVEMAWRRVFATERTTTPVAVVGGDVGDCGVWLYELPATIIPTLAGTMPEKHVSGNPETFTADSFSGNLFGLWAFMQVDYGNQPEGLTGGTGTDIITSAAKNNNPVLNLAHGWSVPWVGITSTPGGGTPEVIFDPISAYSSDNAVAVFTKLPAGVILPAIPYPTNQVSGFLSQDLTDSSGSTAPPAEGSGVGPPDDNTAATSSYTDLSTGQQYTRDPETGAWTPVSGTSFEDSGRFIFTFASATTWVVSHDLLMFPPVTVVNNSGERIWAHVVYDSDAQITVTFSEAVAGKVYLR